MANNQNVNKVVYAGNTLIDLTSDDVTAGDVLSGKKFHLASGAEATGTMPNIGAISGILKGDGNGNVSAATAGTDYVTPAQSLALGLTGASVGDLVRVNAVDANGKPTSWKKVPLNEIKCNKNLLDNWYFVGGGSQLGDGVFPINQRGQTTYSGVGYGIDRWTTTNPNANVDVASSYLRFYGTNGNNVWMQFLCANKTIYGKQITASMLLNNGTLLTITGSLTTATVSTNTGFKSKSVNGINIGVYKRPNGNWLFQIGNAQNGSSVVYADIVAAKLELGSEQTLAHNEGTEENPVWVLNEIPDYGEELRKCQLYFERIQGLWTALGTGYEETSTEAVFSGSCNPKIKKINYDANNVLTGSIYINDSSHIGSNANVVNSVVNFVVSPNGQYTGRARITNGNFVTNTPCRILFRDSTSYIDISAEP